MMLEDIKNRLDDAYKIHIEKHHSECKKTFQQNDGTMLCHGLNEFEEWIQHFYEDILHAYLNKLSNSDNKLNCYNNEIDRIKAKFIEGKHIQKLPITRTTREGDKIKEVKEYKSSIEKDFVSSLIEGKDDRWNSLLISHCFADLKLFEFLINNPPSELSNISLTKMRWKGTQKQLAELFLELQNKGWIEKHEPKTIKESFTPSKSVHQYLKPTKSKITDYKATYENLFGPRYKPQFDTLKENTSS